MVKELVSVLYLQLVPYTSRHKLQNNSHNSHLLKSRKEIKITYKTLKHCIADNNVKTIANIATKH